MSKNENKEVLANDIETTNTPEESTAAQELTDAELEQAAGGASEQYRDEVRDNKDQLDKDQLENSNFRRWEMGPK